MQGLVLVPLPAATRAPAPAVAPRTSAAATAAVLAVAIRAQRARATRAARRGTRSNCVGSGPEYRVQTGSSALEDLLGRFSRPIVNPFLRGNFGPVAHELTQAGLEVLEGAIPEDFPSGSYVRNGPNPYFEPICQEQPLLGRSNHHWFEGDGMLHAVTFSQGTASYRNKWIRTEDLEKEIAQGRPLFRGSIDCDAPALIANIALNVASGAAFKAPSNVGLLHHAGRLLALCEGSPPVEVKLPSLRTVGVHTFKEELVPCPYRGRREFTAHPKVDPLTGEMVFFGFQASPPYTTLGVVSPDGVMRHLAPLHSLSRATLQHDFAITPRFTIVLDLPLVLAPAKLALGKPMIEWEDSSGSRIGVVPRYGFDEDVQWFDVEPGWFLHTVNAYEEGDTVVLRASRCRAMTFFDPNVGNAFNTSACPSVHEWVLDLASGAVKERRLSPPEQWPEFPVINRRFCGLQHRFAYFVDHDWEQSKAVQGPLFGSFLKYTFPDGHWERHELGPGRFGGELAFVPRGGNEEDDGWLVAFVFDEGTDRSELLMLDCRNFTGPPVCRLELPCRVPFGFHGIFVPHS